MSSCPIKYVFIIDHVEGIPSKAVILIIIFFFLNCVKWCSFMLGDTFIFYVSLRGSCTVIAQNGRMSHMSISNIFTLNQIFIALIQAVLYLIR